MRLLLDLKTQCHTATFPELYALRIGSSESEHRLNPCLCDIRLRSSSYEVFLKNWKQFIDHFRAYNIPFIGILTIIIRHSYFIILTVLLSAFGRAISEVGAVMVVGGNIEHYTRVMTTSISLQTRMGNLEYAMALGIVLILLTVLINGFVYIINLRRR